MKSFADVSEVVPDVEGSQPLAADVRLENRGLRRQTIDALRSTDAAKSKSSVPISSVQYIRTCSM